MEYLGICAFWGCYLLIFLYTFVKMKESSTINKLTIRQKINRQC